MITDACAQCNLCVDVCPISAISPGDPIYVINDTCCDFMECVAECPEEAIVPIPDWEEPRRRVRCGGGVMTGSLVTRFVLQDFLAAAAHSYAASAPEQGRTGRLLLLGETSQVLEGWRSWTDAVRLYADVAYRPEWDAAAARTAAQFGVAIEQEFPGDLIPLPAGAEQRHRPVRDLPDSGLSLWHFDPYSVVFRHVARGDEPDYHIVLAYMKYGWIERERDGRAPHGASTRIFHGNDRPGPGGVSP